MLNRQVAVLIVGALLAMVAVSGWAQEDDAQVPVDGEQFDAISDFGLELGMQYNSVDGNERRLYQYVTPPSGLFPSLLSWQALSASGRLALDLGVRDLGEPGPSAELWLTMPSTATFSGDFRRSSFYPDWSSMATRSNRQDYSVDLRSPAGLGSTSWGLSLSEVELYSPWAFEPQDWEQRNVEANLGFQPGGGWGVDVEVRRESFDFGLADALSGDMSSYGVSIASPPSWDTAVTGSYAREITDFEGGYADFKASVASLTATRPISDTLRVSAEAHHRRVDQTVTLNAYGKQDASLRLEAEKQIGSKTTVEGFWQTGEVDYVDGRQLATVSSATNGFGLELKSRPSRQLKLRGAYKSSQIDTAPLSYHLDNTYADTLVYTQRRRLDLSLSYMPDWALGGVTAQWQRGWWENEAQAVDNTVDTKSVTAWWQQEDGQLSATATYLRQKLHLPGLLDVATRQAFGSVGESVILGVTSQVSPRTSLSAHYGNVTARGASRTDGDWLTLSADHRRSEVDTISAMVTFDSFDDAFDTAVGYDADLLRLEWRHNF